MNVVLWHNECLSHIFSHSLVNEAYSSIRQEFYQPHNLRLKYSNCFSSNGLVKMSAICSRVSMGLMTTVLLWTNCLKWWYFNAMCFVRGVNFGFSATLMQLLLSSQAVQIILGGLSLAGRKSWMSFIKLRKGKTCRIDMESAIYSDSVVLRAISDCNLLC